MTRYAWESLIILTAVTLIVLCVAPDRNTNRPAAEPDARSEELKQAHKTVWNEMKAAANQGGSRCCLKWPCSQCILTTGRCTCMADIKAGRPVCHECKGGWHAGDGAVPSVKPEDVAVRPREQVRPPQ